MKKCSRCGNMHPLENFNKKGKNRVQPYCKPCSRDYQRERYHKDPISNAKRQNENRTTRMDGIKADVRKLKEETPCFDCGMKYPHYVTDYDHVNGKKTDSVSGMIRNCASRARIFSEITKCELVCANCHRKRTFRRSGLAKVEGIEINAPVYL